MSYIVSIVGRSNVGKSTFFNRLVGRRKAIVHETVGITRDRIYGYSEWNGVKFYVIDTGGYSININNIIEKGINEQVVLAIKESYVVLFLVDIKTGVLNADIEIANLLRKLAKIILLVINKADNGVYNTDFLRLGFFNHYHISAINGMGTGELLDDLIKIFLKKQFTKEKNIITSVIPIPRFSVLGRPNVGKSTLINSFLGRNQHIVTNISGTTRDSLDVTYNKFGEKCILVDTPGIRKKSKIKEDLEFYSSVRTIKAIEYTDVCFLMIDAVVGWEKQDMNLFRLVEKYKKCIIIIINKWDLFHKKNIVMKQKNLEFFIRKKIHPFYNVPIFFISAKNTHGIQPLLPMAFNIMQLSKNRLKTNTFNKIMLPIFEKTPPTTVKKNNNNKFIKIKYCTQLPTFPPKFLFFSNFPKYINKSYKRFIENKIRLHFGFIGVPIQIFFRKK
ncbi:ribosome biogenesis GTPase Der [Blattabacterium cuenoti]|uniref:ribosome biogenesis GTPase Der n=1 Tax=Blattabacterium cuenoti TaxID=1653831 RepID=UPI00163D2085|nr:ribosome biogenesis GTPase Der [Blattabacterium cuenoti]